MHKFKKNTNTLLILIISKAKNSSYGPTLIFYSKILFKILTCHSLFFIYRIHIFPTLVLYFIDIRFIPQI